MKKTIPKLLTLVCLLVAIMGLSIVTAHAATVTGTISGGNEYRYHEDKTPVPQWGAFTSTKLKYFTRDDTGVTVPAYCMEPSVRSASGDLSYSSTSWSSLSWNQRYDGYVHANKTGAYLPHAMQEVLEGSLGVFGDRLGRLLFKLVVEHNMTNHLLGGDVDMTRDEYSKMRGSSIREVASTHGNISFKDVLLFHQEE